MDVEMEEIQEPVYGGWANPVVELHELSEDEDEDEEEEKKKIDDFTIILHHISNNFADPLTSDIILVVDVNELPANRMILSTSSDVFKKMLMSKNWKESRERKITLHEEPACALVFPHFLKYMYTGEIYLNTTIVFFFLILAGKYNVKELIRLCEDYMCIHVASAIKHQQLIFWLKYSLTCGHRRLYDACINFVCLNFELVFREVDISYLEKDVLVNILKRTKLVVHDEYRLLEYVAVWLKAEKKKLCLVHRKLKAERCYKKLATLIFSYIRFPMMSFRQLSNLCCYDTRKLFKKQMIAALNFHCDITYKPKRNVNRLLFTPRIYTAVRWGSSLCSNDNFRSPKLNQKKYDFTTAANFSEYHGDHNNLWSLSLMYSPEVHSTPLEKYLARGMSKSYKVRYFLIQGKPRPRRAVAVSATVLLYDVQEDIEYVCKIEKKNHKFSPHSNVLPFWELRGVRWGGKYPKSADHHDCLKFHVVITPQCKF